MGRLSVVVCALLLVSTIWAGESGDSSSGGPPGSAGGLAGSLGGGPGSGVSQMGGGMGRMSTVSTTGDAVVDVLPDEILVTIGIETRAPSYDVAKRTNDICRTKLFKGIADVGVGIKTPASDLNTVDSESNSLDRTAQVFVVRGTCVVQMKSLRLYDELIAAVVKTEGCRVLGYELKVGDMRKYADQARDEATHASCDKAFALASALKCRLSSVRTIYEKPVTYLGNMRVWRGWNGTGANLPTMRDPTAPPSLGRDAMVVVNQSAADISTSNDSTTTVLPGHIGVRAEVATTFDIQPK